eukprot:141574-Rhodomonas_salina.1
MMGYEPQRSLQKWLIVPNCGGLRPIIDFIPASCGKANFIPSANFWLHFRREKGPCQAQEFALEPGPLFRSLSLRQMQYRTAVGVAAGAMVALALLALTVTFHGTSSRTALVQRGQGGVAPEVKVKEVAMRLRRRIAEGTRRSKSLASSRVGGYVHRVKKKALMVPAVLKKGGSRVTELAASPATKSELAPAEEARCVGMLHACQSWLELKDGDKNNI